MFEYIKGQLTQLTAKFIVVEAGGVGYLLHVANPYSYSSQMHQEVLVPVYQVVRDDAQLLYGFHTKAEKELFLQLISVTGIGPATALAIIAADDNDGLVAAINDQNIAYLTKFPKIGKKTAQQMVLDLSGSFVVQEIEMMPPHTLSALDEACEALEALGYKPSEIKKVAKALEGTQDSAEQYIKQGLRLLLK